MEKSKKIKDFFLNHPSLTSFGIIFITILFFTRKWLTHLLAFGDFTPFSTNYYYTLHSFLYVWDTNFLGFYGPKLILDTARSFLELISFFHPIIAQDIYILGIMIIGAIGCFMFLRKNLEVRSSVACVLSIFFLFNPVTLSEYANGAAGIFLLYSLIPLLFISFNGLLKKYTFKKGIYFSILIGIYLINIQTTFWIFLGLIVFFVFFILIEKTRLKNIFFILFYGCIGGLLNLIAFFPLIQNSGSYSNGSFIGDFDYTYSQAKLVNLFRLAANNGSLQAALGYFGINVFNCIAFILPLIIFIAIVTFNVKTENRMKIKWYLFAVTTFLSTILYIYLTHLGLLNSLILKKELIIVSTRNPQKLLYLMAFSYTLLLAMGLEKIISYFQQKDTFKRKCIIEFFIVLLFIIIYFCQNPYFLAGDFGMNEIGEKNFWVETKYDAISKIFEGLGSNSKILLLPYDRNIQLKTSDGDSIAEYPLGAERIDVENNPLNILFDEVCSGDDITKEASELGINYVTIDKNPTSSIVHQNLDCQSYNSYGTPYIWGTTSFFENIFQKFPVYYQDSNFIIYKLGSEQKESIGSITPSFIFSGTSLNRDLTDQASSYLVASSNNKVTPSTYIKNIFDEVGQSISTTTLQNSKDNFVDIDNNGNDIVANISNNILSFYRDDSYSLLFNGKNITSSSSTSNENIASVVLKNQNEYYVSNNQALFGISEYNKNIDIGYDPSLNPIDIYSINKNLVPNNSFETGLWQQNVSDCNNYDNNPQIGMELDTSDKTDGKQSLELEATRHTACTATTFPINSASSTNILSFDYQSTNGKQAGYYISFNDPNKTIEQSLIGISDTNWHTYSTEIKVPKKSTSATLFLYAYSSNNQTKIINHYDNVNFGQLEKVTSINVKNGPLKQVSIQTNSSKNKFVYKNSDLINKNIIDNGSFENGLWQQTVSDCDSYDDNPQIAMELDAKDKNDGNQSLELDATRHTACTSINIPLKGGSTYNFSFDYQTPNAAQASYFISFNDPTHTTINNSALVSNKKWNTYSSYINTPIGANEATLYIYANSTDGVKKIINRYDNFKLIQIPDLTNTFYVVNSSSTNLIKPKSIISSPINPTKKLVHIKGATTPFYLAMSESYHPSWQLEMNNSKINGWLRSWISWTHPDMVPANQHFELDDFLNGWYVDVPKLCITEHYAGCTKNADGSYNLEMVIEFWPQRWFYVGLIVSGTTLVGILGYLGYDIAKRIKRKTKSREVGERTTESETDIWSAEDES